uniref:Uncharacterized protein n=1 Tax=Chlamydomonas leiostraca TaxID=1034604 RepID=A0A7S0WYN8_9CHLO
MLRLAELTHLGLRVRVVDADSNKLLAANATLVTPTPKVVVKPAGPATNWQLSVVMMPGVQYEVRITPWDPVQPGRKFEIIVLKEKVDLSWDDVVFGKGRHGLAIVREVKAVVLG